MGLILVDTSVWVDYFRGRETEAVSYVSDAIEKEEDLCVCGIVLTEVLQGIPAQKDYEIIKAHFDRLIFLPMPESSYILAADIYRQARSKGATIRSTVDCLIAACAIVHRAGLVHNDKDYETIAKFSKLEVINIK